MNYLLDTCVISELVKPSPDIRVVQFLRDCQENQLYLSVITCGEILKGIAKLEPSAKKNRLIHWVKEELYQRFKGRILTIDLNIACLWGDILAQTERQGKTIPAIDALIAATALSHHLTILTRNIPDMAGSGALLLNPWSNQF